MVLISSCDENLSSKGSCDPPKPIVFSVPNNIKCLSGVDTKENLLAVGAFVIALALPANPSEVGDH